MAFTPREERKTRLAEAAWQVILEHGVSAVSVRTVAAGAGMSVGSLRHLFPSQSELLKFSAELMVERATARVSATPLSPDGVAYALAAIRELMPLAPETRREFEISIALIAETPANPGLARIRDHAHEQLLDLFTRIAAMLRNEPASTPDSRCHARRLLALVDGLGLHLLHQPLGDDTEWAIEIVRDELLRIRDGGAGGQQPVQSR
ncbi:MULTISPECIES: TetR/AcrR family transcriptional regulator [unclassified Streptomyces]|uniref:TetR/AcrR family transcriptional regulator n=1 Tax=unclassified Streptomyces TaxID=2593676 RepID=UPI0036F5C4A2